MSLGKRRRVTFADEQNVVASDSKTDQYAEEVSLVGEDGKLFSDLSCCDAFKQIVDAFDMCVDRISRVSHRSLRKEA